MPAQKRSPQISTRDSARDFYAERARESGSAKPFSTQVPSATAVVPKAFKRLATSSESRGHVLPLKYRFLAACEHGNLDLIKQIIEQEIKDKNGDTSKALRTILNQWKDGFGRTGFMFAASSGNTQLVEYFLSFPELDIEMKDSEQKDAIDFANSYLHTHVATIISEEVLRRKEAALKL